MFDPQRLFPIVRKSMTKGTDEQVMDALTKFSKAHQELNEMQALAALQAYMKSGKASLGSYLRASQGGVK